MTSALREEDWWVKITVMRKFEWNLWNGTAFHDVPEEINHTFLTTFYKMEDFSDRIVYIRYLNCLQVYIVYEGVYIKEARGPFTNYKQ